MPEHVYVTAIVHGHGSERNMDEFIGIDVYSLEDKTHVIGSVKRATRMEGDRVKLEMRVNLDDMIPVLRSDKKPYLMTLMLPTTDAEDEWYPEFVSFSEFADNYMDSQISVHLKASIDV